MDDCEGTKTGIWRASLNWALPGGAVVVAALTLFVGAASAATPVTVGGGWHDFTTDIPGSPSQMPFTYTASGPTLVTITDLFCILGEHYLVSDNGATLGATSPEQLLGCQEDYAGYTTNPDVALADPNYSHGRFAVGAGSHAITVVFQGQIGISAGAAIRVDAMTARDCENGGWAEITASPPFAGEADCLTFVGGAHAMLAELADAAVLGPGTSLADKVGLMQSYLTSGDVTDTCTTLAAFVREVTAQSGKKIPADHAAELTALAQQIRVVLAC
jgi:hypothetical protein